MKRNLNLITTAASFILLALPGESYALQNHHESLVGSGILSENRIEEANLPSVVKSERKLLAELKPLKMPKLKQYPTSVRPVPNTAFKPEVSSQGSQTKTAQASSRLPDLGVPVDQSGNTGAPPIIKKTSRRLSQTAQQAYLPPAVKGNGLATESPIPTALPPIVEPSISSATTPTTTAESVQPAAYYPQGSSSRVPLPAAGSATRSVLQPVQGSATRAPLPTAQGSSTRAPLPTAQGSATREPLPAQGSSTRVPTPAGGSSTRSGVDSNFAQDGATPAGQPQFGESFVDNGNTGNRGPDFSNGPIIEDFGTFGSVSAARCYFHAEALLFTRADGDISGPGIAQLNDFDFGPGLRLTAGRKTDSIFGREVSVFALNDIDQDSSIINSPFLAEDFQEQTKESELYSIEFNRVNWGWDLIKTYVGFKYIKFDDSYRILSTDAAVPGLNNFASLDTTNNLFGVQFGGELFYDIGYRWSASIGGEWGLFGNFNDFDASNSTNGGPLFQSEDDGFTISSAAEFKILAHYQIQTNLRFQVGYNLIFVGNVSSVADNFTGLVPSLNGVEATDSDDVFFHGLSFGLEFYR